MDFGSLRQQMMEAGASAGLEREAAAAFDAAVKAGRVLMDHMQTGFSVNYKGVIDLVTDADIAAEEAIKSELATIDGTEILAEESAKDMSMRKGRFWIVDPLDGTTNFAHAFPFFAVSIALAEIGEGYSTLIGIVYLPRLDEFFWSVRSQGAWLNSERLNVSKEDSLKRSLLATGFPYDVHSHPEQIVAALKEMLVRAQGIRRAGAAAIDLAYVAAGRFEGFWEKKLKPWDTAAGMLLVEEAGGWLSDFGGRRYHPFMKEIVASNGRIHEEMVSILSDFSG